MSVGNSSKTSRKSQIFSEFILEPTDSNGNKNYNKYSCKYCEWKTINNATRMLSHIATKCQSVPMYIKKTYCEILSNSRREPNFRNAFEEMLKYDVKYDVKYDIKLSNDSYNSNETIIETLEPELDEVEFLEVDDYFSDDDTKEKIVLIGDHEMINDDNSNKSKYSLAQQKLAEILEEDQTYESIHQETVVINLNQQDECNNVESDLSNNKLTVTKQSIKEDDLVSEEDYGSNEYVLRRKKRRQEDEYDIFGAYIACQLRKLSNRRAEAVKSHIFDYLTQEIIRVNVNKNT